MTENKWHKQLKDKIAGEDGITEFPIDEGTKIDIKKLDRSTEIETRPTQESICKAIGRLETQQYDKKEILVKDKYLDKTKGMAENCSSDTEILIQNPDRTKRRFVNY